MVTVVPERANIGDQIGRAIRQSIEQNVNPAIQQQYQKGRLEKAFNAVEPGGNYLEQLKKIAPELLTTPGGAQAFAEISGPLAQIAQSEASRNAINKRREANTPSANNIQNAPRAEAPNKSSENMIYTGPETQISGKFGNNFRNPSSPMSPMTPFPERTAGPTTTPEMTPRQLEDYTLDLMQQSADMGTPVPYSQAHQTALATNADIRASNQIISQQKKEQDLAQSKLTEGMVARAENAGLVKNPEDRTIISKFALEAKNAANEKDAWEYVRTKARQWEAAQNGLSRNYQLPGPIDAGMQKLAGTYKDLSQAGDEAQRYLDFYRDNGLYDDARRDLTTKVGLGAEDAETWLFPFSKQQKDQLALFPKNTIQPHGRRPFQPAEITEMFPSIESIMPQKEYDKFKEGVYNFLRANPGANLISLRGNLNRDKKYAWQDISRAYNELLDEKRFNPDAVQEQQMTVTNSAPLPGLAQQFQFLWKGKK